MPQIPLVDIPEGPGSAPPIAARANPAMFAPIERGAEQLGQGLSSLGELGARIKRTYDDSVLTNVGSVINAAHADFQNSLLDPSNPQNGDPQSFPARWAKIKQGVMQQVGQLPGVKFLSPAARLQLQTIQADTFRRADLAVTQTMRERMVEHAVGVGRTAINQAVLGGDGPNALAHVDDMAQKGLLNPEEAAQMRIDIPRQVDQVDLTKLMMMDPLHTPGGPQVALQAMKEQDKDGAFVNFPHLLPEQRQMMEFHASRMLNVVRADIASRLVDESINGNGVDPTEVKGYVARHLMSRTEAAHYLKPAKTFDQAATAQILSSAQGYDPTKDADRSLYAQLSIAAASQSVPPSVRAEVANLLRGKVNQSDHPMNSLTAKSGVAEINQAWESRRPTWEKKVQTFDETGAHTSTQVDQGAYEAAMAEKTAALTAFQKWVMDPKNADRTPADAHAFISGFHSDWVKGAAAQLLTPAAAPAAMGPGDLKALLRRYGYDGG